MASWNRVVCVKVMRQDTNSTAWPYGWLKNKLTPSEAYFLRSHDRSV